MISVMIVILAMAQCGPGGCAGSIQQAPFVRLLPPQSQPVVGMELAQPHLVLPESTPLRTLPTPVQQTVLTPTPQAPPVTEAPPDVQQELEVADNRDWGWHVVVHDGMVFPAWGYHVDERTVRWSPSYPANAGQIERARALYHPEWREQQTTKPRSQRRSL
jgi:hypothetical protein